jgi:hypothetical protein
LGLLEYGRISPTAKLFLEYVADINEVNQLSALNFQREYNNAKAAGHSDKRAKKIAMKRAKNYWNIWWDKLEKKYADYKSLMEDYARKEILKRHNSEPDSPSP